ncbi:GumC family protein [Carboxylicivirga linearis]|uniref:non-specific protein-tyrosine kinase n=1 Tax=Carboxylicivirga linearis TaxID=1628157 RepID=A0ABS5JW33_9BACT|nr:polysaccharide biosynthesis tyrosine autokinase [Carboxylicivirga linearis]MBS2099111.1 polysaccharide biosynthesis tyrosine autokinase [Carboxylicivirga linearis]
MNDTSQKQNKDQYLDLKKVVSIVLKKWYFYVIAIVDFILIAFVLGKIIAPTYEVSSSIYIKENSSLQSQKATEFLQSFQLFDQNRAFQNEMLILKSTPLITETVEQLNLEVEYYQTSNLIEKEIYHAAPFVVLYDSSHVQAINVSFCIEFLADGKFYIEAEEDEVTTIDYSSGQIKKSIGNLAVEGSYFQSDLVMDDLFSFRVFLKDASQLQDIVGNRYCFVFKDKNSVVKGIKDNLKVAPENPEVSIVEIRLKDHSKEKAIDFVTTLTDIYLKKNLNRKNHLAQNTIAYINSQLEEISDSLTVAEHRLESFRSGNQVIDISSKATRIFERLHQLELEKSTTDRQYQYYQYLDEFFEENDDLSDLVVPSSMGITDQTLNDLMRDLIILVNQRSELIGKKQEKSPYLRNIEIQIESLKKPIIENIEFSLRTLDRTMNDLNSKINETKRSLEALPRTERQLVGFERKFQLNDAIYTFLLQRRAEAQIAKASNLPEHEIVEPAQLIRQVFPNPQINYSLAVLLGILVPSMLIMLLRFFDDRIKGEQALDEFSDLPFLGSVLKNTDKEEVVVAKNPNTAIAETFRTIRTNLFFFIKRETHKTVLVTSSVAGEGKSFVSLNLALSLASMGKKVVLVGYDLRKSKQYANLVDDHKVGLASYYVGSKVLSDIIQTTQYKGLEVITPGVIPPNPLELIAGETTKDIFRSLKKQYEYIVVDSSPIGVVSDAYFLMQYSDINVFVVRENFSKKTIVESVFADMQQKEVKNIGVLLNASRLEDRKYRYEYYNKYNSEESDLK